jgi:hypothetical protein
MTTSWTVAPTGYLQERALGARPLDGAGAGAPPLAPGRGSGLPVAGIGVPMCTAAPFSTHITTIVPRFDGTTLGIPSSRRPLS